MDLVNEFTVPATTDDAWKLLTDVSRIAPCLPGATVEDLGGDTYAGTVAVKVGPIKVSYSGTASFRELDQSGLRMVLDAGGKEKSGKGSANAVITLELHSESELSTRVHVHTDLQITGKVAQFGRSAMGDICARLVDQFAANLEALLADDGAVEGTSAPAAPPRVELGLSSEGATTARPASMSRSDVGGRPSADPTRLSAQVRTMAARQAGTSQAGPELNALTLMTPLLTRSALPVLAFGLGVLCTWLSTRLRIRIVRISAPRAARPGYGPS